MRHPERCPSPCTITTALGTRVEKPQPRVFVPREKRAIDNDDAKAGGEVVTCPMYYVLPKRAADAMQGSKNALKQLRSITIYGVFENGGNAHAFLVDHKLMLVAKVIKL